MATSRSVSILTKPVGINGFTSKPSVHVHHIDGRTRGAGSVLALFTDGPSDLTVAATAAAIAAQTGTLLVAAAAVTTTGLSPNPLLHHARSRRMSEESTAIIGRVTPILATAGVAWTPTTLVVPPHIDPALTLPAAAVRELVGRFAVVTVVTAAAPPGYLGNSQLTPLNGTPTNLDRL